MNKIYFHADDYGRSKQISNNIINCIKKGNINSVSVMVSYLPYIYHKKLKNLKNVNIKLHLNLTELPRKNLKKINDLSFLKLVFLKSKNKKIIYNEIENQIKRYKKLYKLKSIQIDGHEHVQMIPWIFNFIKKLKKNIILPKLEFLMKNCYFQESTIYLVLAISEIYLLVFF